MSKAVQTIFSPQRRRNRFKRAYFGKQDAAEAHPHGTPLPDFLTEVIAEDMVERLSFLRYEPRVTAHYGLGTLALSKYLTDIGAATIPKLDIEEGQPFNQSAYDLLTSINLADTINDLPGALIQIRLALKPGGLAMVTFPGAGSLPQLRRAVMQAEIERPAARMHPLIDARAGAWLLQRAGWKDPVVDTREVHVSYRSIDMLVADLRAHGLTNVLSSKPPPLTRSIWQRAREAFMEQAREDGRVTETFSFITLTGRRSLAGT